MTEVIDAEGTEEPTVVAHTELVRLPRVRYQMDEVAEAIRELDRFKTEVMREEIDYGVIPGVEKPSLFKPGAERLMHAFGFGSTVELVRSTEDWDRGLFYYVYRAGVGPMVDGVLTPIAWCEGSANSYEAKFRYHGVPDFVASEEQKANAIKKVKKENKNGGVYYMLTVENENPADKINTLQKISQKRAIVGAVLLATATSQLFTQDVEDFVAAPAPEPRAPAPIPTPMAGTEPEDIIMPWGKKHMGEPLGQIHAEDPSYTKWLRKTLAEKEAKGELPHDQLPLRDAVNALLEGE